MEGKDEDGKVVLLTGFCPIEEEKLATVYNCGGNQQRN
jgi:hypothetical protein